MNKDKLVELVLQSGFVQSKNRAEDVVYLIFNSIKEEVRKGNEVRIAGFGILKKVQVKARSGHNPNTGAVVAIPARGKVKFSVASAFKELVK